MSTARKIKMLLAATDHNMKHDNFSEKELQEIAEVLGAKVEIYFVLEDGTRI